ncbi:MAG: cysteine desulfurase family protein [Candidatus Paceibacterota bacterium]
MKRSEKRQRKTLYFDHAATTPLTKEAFWAIEEAYSEGLGNPGSIHSFGRKALALLDKSREKIAGMLGGDFSGVVFTGSATEANNLAVRGTAKRYIRRPGISDGDFPARIVISDAEHESVEKIAEKMSEEGCEVVRVRVKKDGCIDLKALEEAINGRTALVSLIFTNNETGAVNNIKRASSIISEIRKERDYPLFHIDASQSFRYEDCSFLKTGADMITLSSHKVGGPKGVGVLCCRNKDILKKIEPLILGGGQEFGYRSGTENVPAISGFTVALEEADRLRKKETERLRGIKKYLFEGISEIFPKTRVNGPKIESSSPHILNIWLPGKSAEEVVVFLDMAGIAVSYGSACSARAFKSSRVLESMGYSEKRVLESIRISSGRETTMAEAKAFISIFRKLEI